MEVAGFVKMLHALAVKHRRIMRTIRRIVKVPIRKRVYRTRLPDPAPVAYCRYRWHPLRTKPRLGVIEYACYEAIYRCPLPNILDPAGVVFISKNHLDRLTIGFLSGKLVLTVRVVGTARLRLSLESDQLPLGF